MNYYALQVKTRSEDQFIKCVTQSLLNVPHEPVNLLFPKRKLPIKKGGHNTIQIESLFPGYIFIETENLKKTVIYFTLRSTPGFFRFLPDNKDPKPLEGRDLATLRHFASFGEFADKSRVYFDENDRIQIVDGPLKGLEGRIIKVDKRKGRAKIKLDLYDQSFPIDLGFEIIGRPE